MSSTIANRASRVTDDGGSTSTQGGSSGNFHVCVRIRPTNSPNFENQPYVENQKYIRSGPENSMLLVQPHATQGDKVFIYDEVFDSKSKTKDIFEKVVRPNLTGSLFKGKMVDLVGVIYLNA